MSFEKQDYPTYHIGMDYLSDYKHSVRTVIRAWMLAFLLNRTEIRDLGVWITKNIEEDDFNKIVNEYLQNKSILEVTKSRGCQDNYNKLCDKFGN